LRNKVVKKQMKFLENI